MHNVCVCSVLSPSDRHRLGGAVTGDDGDETRVVSVLSDTRGQQRGVSHRRPITGAGGLKAGGRGSYPQDEADGGHPGRGHDLGAVGHQVEQRGHDALGAVVELVAQDGRQVSVGRATKKEKRHWSVFRFAVPPDIVPG